MKTLKENKKTFYLKILSSFKYSQLFAVASAGTGWQYQNRVRYLRQKPAYGSELLAIGRAIQFYKNQAILQFSHEELDIFLQKLHRIYWPYVLEKWEAKPNRKQDIKVTATQYMDELLWRDFFFSRDIRKKPGCYYIENREFQLTYFMQYDTEQKAEAANKLHGIYGITVVTFQP